MEYEHTDSFSRAAASCGKKVAMGSSVGVAGLALIATAIDNRAAIASAWRSLLWNISMGGNFWAAVVVCGVAMASCAWAVCTWEHLAQKHRAKRPLLAVAMAACVLWFVGYRAVQSTYVEFFDLTVYAMFAVVAVTIPALFVAAGIVVVAVELGERGRVPAEADAGQSPNNGRMESV
uniref:hypothetical protein n=1 Tax=Cupriavidus gilardii TaxID=82541 RepID=UPI00247A360B|nr:hypothetical protein [Cupriavidus gilardii]WDE72659.1 hypothetical protein [Cupriavidus gilardii]